MDAHKMQSNQLYIVEANKISLTSQQDTINLTADAVIQFINQYLRTQKGRGSFLIETSCFLLIYIKFESYHFLSDGPT